MKVWCGKDFTPARLPSQCISIPLQVPPFQKTQIFTLAKKLFSLSFTFLEVHSFIYKYLLTNFVNPETIFLNLSPAEKLTEVRASIFIFFLPDVSLWIQGKRGKDIFQILHGSRIGLGNQTQVNQVSYLVSSFTSDFKDTTVKRLRWRKEISGILRVISQVLSFHIRHASLAQNNIGDLQVELCELLPHAAGRLYKLRTFSLYTPESGIAYVTFSKGVRPHNSIDLGYIY